MPEGSTPDAAPVAVVTGAGSGIGAAIATKLHADGFRVALLGRDRGALERTQERCRYLPAATEVIATDVTVTSDVVSAFRDVHAHWGRVDLLVNNAGTLGATQAVEDLGIEDWERVLATNVTGALRCTQEAVRLMRQQLPSGGRIVNVGSVSAHRPRPNSVAYAASKSALAALSRSTSLEGRDAGISCTDLFVGNATTELSRAARVGPTAVSSAGIEASFDPDHVATIVVALARLPTSVSVPELTMIATGMPLLGRG